MSIQITKNFELGEFYYSENHPDIAARMVRTIEDAVSITRLAVTLVQPIREFLDAPVKVNSGKRDAALNRAVGGSETSQHELGEAADLDLRGDVAWKVFKWLLANKKSDVGQVIIYLTAAGGSPEWLHVSVPSLRGSTKAVGDFRVKVDGNEQYFRYGIDKIPV